MSEKRHTPGPWHVFGPYESGYVISAQKNGEQSPLHGYGRGFDKVDAYLIAAAPDMLEALEKVNEFIANGDMDCPDPAHEVPALVQVAINKAKRGET